MRVKSVALFAVFVLAAGMSSADVLASFGVVSGEVEVEGPTFYAADDEELILDVPEDDERSDYSQVGPGPGDVEFYDSLNLGGKEWYDVRADMYATLNKEDNGTLGSVQMEFNYKSSSGSWNGCSEWVDFNDTNRGDYQVVSGNCDVSVPGEVEKFEYVLSSRDELGIQAQGDTRVEVNAQ